MGEGLGGVEVVEGKWGCWREHWGVGGLDSGGELCRVWTSWGGGGRMGGGRQGRREGGRPHGGPGPSLTKELLGVACARPRSGAWVGGSGWPCLGLRVAGVVVRGARVGHRDQGLMPEACEASTRRELEAW